MNKIYFSLLLLSPCLLSAHDWALEVRGGYFWPQQRVVREIYHHGGGEVELEGMKWVYKGLNVWANVNYFPRSGQSIGPGDSTRINLVPLSWGVKYFFPLVAGLDVYLGGGASYTFVRIKDNSCFVEEHVSKGGFGGVGKFGVAYTFNNHLFLDLFADYYSRMRFHPKNPCIEGFSVNFGGIRTGLGIGMAY